MDFFMVFMEFLWTFILKSPYLQAAQLLTKMRFMDFMDFFLEKHF